MRCSVTALITKPDLEVVFPPTRNAPAAARRLLACAGLDTDVEHAVSLLVSELVTNSLIHAPGLKGIGLRAVLASDYARIEVRDTGPGFDPDQAQWGFGLRLLDKLAARWGAEQGAYGVVWFEVDRRSSRFRR
jgi:two-component sensor histidine kinase